MGSYANAWVNYSNRELRQRLKGFPKHLFLYELWSVGRYPVYMAIGLVRKRLVERIASVRARVRLEKCSEEDALRRILKALYTHILENRESVEGDTAYVLYKTRTVDELDAKEECYRMPARILVQTFLNWYEDWEKDGCPIKEKEK